MLLRTMASIVLPLSLANMVQAQPKNPIVMSCFVPSANPRKGPGLVRPSSKEETARLRSAPHGAGRIGKHELQIGWQQGKQIFTDKPPLDVPLDDLDAWWSYCGYDPELGEHLLLEQNPALFTGVLLDDRTGKVLQAGEKVLFSPDQKFYLAYDQPDGQDGETIKLFTRSGTLLWKGYNGILSADRMTIVASFENIRWDDQDTPLADAHLLPHGGIEPYALAKGPDGKLSRTRVQVIHH